MAENSELKIGDLSVSDILGMGGAGISYRAGDKNGNQVFLKVLKWEYLRKNDELEQEYALHRLSELSHPGLAKVFDIGYTTAGKLWYTRELLEDESKNLASFKSTILEMDEIGAGLLILQILDALDFLHRNGFIHGNLKESNIKLVKGNTDTNFLWHSSKKSKSPFTVKLTDFCLLEPFNESASDILLPTFKTESDDLRSLGRILYKTYIDDDANGGYSVIKIRDKVPEPLQVLITRLLGISREAAFNSCAEAISTIGYISPQRASELSAEKLQKNIRLSKDIERQNYLLDILSDTEQSNGKFIILEGEDGSGKTVLVREFVKTAMFAKKQVSIFTCSNHHRPAEGLIRLLDDFLHILKDKNPAIVNHYEQVFARIKGERIPESGLLLDDQTELFEGLIKLLKELSELKPFCLIMEDIELASDYLLNFISMLLADLNDSKILLVATIAPSRIRSPQQSLFDAICSYDSVNRVQVQQLDYKNTIEHMRNLLTAPELPEDICARFYESTGGNILKLDELVKTAIAKGVLVISNDSHHFDIRKFADISEDIEINQIVGRLVSNLHSNERAICQFISMFGGKAQLDAIETFTKKSGLLEINNRKELANIVWNLIAKGVLRRRFEAGGFHLFISHKLFADGIISSIPIEERKRIYDSIVLALANSEGEMYFPERDIRISLLALKGNSPENAIRWAVRAQAMCERQYALDEKVFFLTKLIQMIPEEEIEFANNCQIKLAYTHFRRKEFGLAGKKISRVKAENPIDDAIISIIASKTEGFDSWMYLEKAIKNIDQLQDVQLRKNLINTYLGKLQIIDPRRASEFAKNFAHSSDNSFDKIACFLTLSRISAAMADFDIAVEYADKALAQTSGLEFTSERIFVSIWKIKLAQMMGDQTTASRLIRRMSGLLSGKLEP
ncbi:MAG: AAA family ATPase [Caldisericia bacterium]